MSGNEKQGRKRRPTTQLIISKESSVAMRARLDPEEGQRGLHEVAKLIAGWPAKAMPDELLRAMGTPECKKVLQELRPGIVNAFLKADSHPTASK